MREEVQWFLLFRLSQFVVDLFTFLLVALRRSALRLVLGALLLRTAHRRHLLLLGLLQRFARCGRCGGALFRFRARKTGFLYLYKT